MNDKLLAAVPKPGERPTAAIVAKARSLCDDWFGVCGVCSAWGRIDTAAEAFALLPEAVDRLESLTVDLAYAREALAAAQTALDGKYWEHRHGGTT